MIAQGSINNHSPTFGAETFRAEARHLRIPDLHPTFLKQVLADPLVRAQAEGAFIMNKIHDGDPDFTEEILKQKQAEIMQIKINQLTGKSRSSYAESWIFHSR